METPSDVSTIQLLLVRLALLSTTASTLMRPTGPTLKDDIKQNLTFFSPINSIAKVLWLFVVLISLRLPRIMSTKVIVWLTLTLCAHWQVCEADSSKHMKHRASVHFARRAILVGITLPAFMAMILLDDHRWTQFFMAWLVGDAVVTEALTLFSLPTPGTIYLHKDWPEIILLSSELGPVEISTKIDCTSLKDEKKQKVDQNDSTEQEGEETPGKEPSSGQTQQQEPEQLFPQNLCNRVQRLSDSLLGADVEANMEHEPIKNDICTMLRLLYPFRITWTCRHRLCLVYKACSFLAPLMLLIQRQATAIFIFWLFAIDIQPLIPPLVTVIDETYLLHLVLFIVYETFFVACVSFFTIIALGVFLKRVPKAQSIFDAVSNSLARRTGFQTRRVKVHITSAFVIWPLQAYFYWINPVPMTEERLSVFVTLLYFALMTSIAWKISTRILSRTSENDGDDKNTSTDRALVGKGTASKAKADIAFSLMFVPVALWFICARF
ncbi:uncharacterized protein KD926_004622 [Aspergillus affinis]|uniref:uncharacterized protein n=1 Tax=Aspergillus affinis TaxID=1070780 RepID=UPI0022FE5366|nr:uncharacterized protein KD926_004622 [Aspergillus affinis]KAI9043119.1 hypothetical protein KD926_004622 [Aspergillus affinis]